MPTLGIIGSGNIGAAIARLATAAGTPVVVANSRGPETLIDLVAELGRGGDGPSELSLVFSALGDPTRREILRVLRMGDLTAGEIAARFPMTAASVSHHLSVLKEAGLVRSERNGRNLVYSLETTVFQEFLQQMLEMFGNKGDER